MNWTPIIVALVLAASPFWESKTPEQWDNRELVQLLTDSPWAQMVSATGKGLPAPGVLVFLASAAPMQQAEQERRRRARLTRNPGTPEPEDPLNEEYKLWLADNRASQIVVAVRMQQNAALSDEAEIRRMEEESVLHAGRRKFKMTGHFPPSPSDPYLRLAFPRQVQLSDKNLILDLYLPGVPAPYRSAQFSLKDMTVMGKLEL
jgi:hypothetical protein